MLGCHPNLCRKGAVKRQAFEYDEASVSLYG